MSTAAAQRRLLEALSALQHTPVAAEDIGRAPDPLAAFSVGVQFAADVAAGAGQDGTARIYLALSHLVDAVRSDLKEVTHD